MLEVLYEVGIYGTKAKELADRQDITPDDIRAHMQAAIKAGRDNPQGFVIRLIEAGAPAPKPHDPDYERRKYIMGEFADYVRH